MRPIDEIARTAFELLQHGDQDARLIGDVTVGEMLSVMTFAGGAFAKLCAEAEATKPLQVSDCRGYQGQDR